MTLLVSMAIPIVASVMEAHKYMHWKSDEVIDRVSFPGRFYH